MIFSWFFNMNFLWKLITLQIVVTSCYLANAVSTFFKQFELIVMAFTLIEIKLYKIKLEK